MTRAAKRSDLLLRAFVLVIGVPALVLGGWGAVRAWAFVIGGPPDVPAWDPLSRPDGILAEDVVGAALLSGVALIGAGAVAVVIYDVVRTGRPPTPRPAQVAPASRLRPVARVFIACQFIVVGLFLAFLVGSFLLSGLQMTARDTPNWEQFVPFPIFFVPDVLLVALAGVGAGAAIVWAITSRANEAGQFVGALGSTAAAGIGAFFFWFAYAEDQLTGIYPAAIALSAVSGMVLVVTALVQDRRARVVPG